MTDSKSKIGNTCIVLENGWKVYVEKNTQEIFNDLLNTNNDFIDVLDAAGHRYCINVKSIVCVKKYLEEGEESVSKCECEARNRRFYE